MSNSRIGPGYTTAGQATPPRSRTPTREAPEVSDIVSRTRQEVLKDPAPLPQDHKAITSRHVEAIPQAPPDAEPAAVLGWMIDDVVGLLREYPNAGAAAGAEPKLMARLGAAFDKMMKGQQPHRVAAMMLKTIEQACQRLRETDKARGDERTSQVLQAAFAVAHSRSQADARQTHLLSALALGLGSERAVRAWMGAHAGASALGDLARLAMSGFVAATQRDGFKTPWLVGACEGLAMALACGVKDGKAVVDAAGMAQTSRDLAELVMMSSLEPQRVSQIARGLARGFDGRARDAGNQAVAQLLNAAMACDPPQPGLAVAALQGWRGGLVVTRLDSVVGRTPAQTASAQASIRDDLQAAVDEAVPRFSPKHSDARKALLAALHGAPAKVKVSMQPSASGAQLSSSSASKPQPDGKR